MDSSALGEGTLAASGRRVLSSKQPAPPPPQKVLKCDPVDVEIQDDDISKTLSATHRKALLKQSQDRAKEPQALVFRKLDDHDNDQGSGYKAKPGSEQKVSLTHAGEKLLKTFYGMLYTNGSTEKEWKLEVDEFLLICFVQVQGNANKPFRIIAVDKSKRIMEYQVNVNTTCARNSTFVKWQDGVSMFGVRFGKEDQAEQFVTEVKRMASTLNKTALVKQPERQAIIRPISDPDSTSNVQHTEVSLMIKLPDKQSTLMSVPGLLTMSELFETICERENLIPAEHQLSLPRTGAKKVTFDSGTAIDSLKIREVAIVKTVMTSQNSGGSVEVEDEYVEDLLDTEEEENKILQLILPNGVKKSYRVSLDMTIKQLVMRVCSQEGLNPRHHSLQCTDFKHEFLEAGSTVDEIGVSQVRLMDKRVLKRNSLTIIKASVTDDDSPSNSPHTRKHRKSCGDAELESDGSGTNEGDKENGMSWQQRSKSLEALVDAKQNKALSQQDGHVPKEDSQKHLASNGSVPTKERRNSSEATTIKKPPIPPLPYVPKSANLKQNQPGNLTNGTLRDQKLSPIKKNGIMSASTPDLSTISSRSDSPDMKTSTPDTKSRRRAAPPPPRPAAPKVLFRDAKTNTQVDGAGLAVKTNNPSPDAPPQAPAVGELKLKPSHKKRPAPPRPERPAPPQPAPRLTKQGSQESKVVNGPGREKEVSVQLKQDKEARSIDRASLSLNLKTHRRPLDEEPGGDQLSDLRGIPIFIPPPPPDELPPPLDECETPVGPLTDFEADILEGTTNDDFPGTLNGYVDIQNIGMFACHGAGDSQAPTVPKSRQETALESVPEQSYIPDRKELYPVVPPPPLYSEPESSSLSDIPPLLSETQTIQTSQGSEEKENDSGFDQSSEHLIITPREDPSDDVQVGHSEDPDNGSSLDVFSAIPPPADFETPPLTPPCQFANPNELPPEGFLNSVRDDKKEEPEKPRKKLDVSEGLFPWMNEPQAPVNAVMLLDEPKDSEDDVIVKIDVACTAPTSENRKDSSETIAHPSVDAPSASITTDVDSRPVPHEDEKPAKPELEVKQNVVLGITEVNAEAKSSVKLQRSSSVDQNRESASVQKPKTTESNEIVVNKVMVTNENSKESGSHQVLDMTVKPLKPETTAKPVAFVKETEVKVEPDVDVQQYALSSFTPSTEAARPKQQPVRPPKPDLQVKPEKPETKAKPGPVVRETEVKVEQLPSLSVKPPFRAEPLLDLAMVGNQIKPDKPDRIIIPATVIKEPESRQLPPSKAARTQPLIESFKPEQDKPEKPEKTVKPVLFANEVGVKVDVKAPALSSFNPSTEAARGDPPVLPEKQENESPVEEAIAPQSKPEVEMSVKMLPEEQHDRLVQETPVKIVTVEKEDIVSEALVTPEIKPISRADDKLKDLEAKLQELDKEPAPSSTELKTLESKTVPLVYKEVEHAVQANDPLSEEVIVADTKQVEFSNYEHFEKLFNMDSDEPATKENTRVQHKEDKTDVIAERQWVQSENFSSHVEEKPELILDLSSLRQSSEPPRPPSSSPPAASPRSSSLPSPVALDSARSTDSGFATLEKPKYPSSLDSKPLGPTALSNSAVKTSEWTNVSITAGVSNEERESKPPALQTEKPTAGIDGKPPTTEKPSNVRLQRPLSMPAGFLRVVKSDTVQDKTKSAESDLRESSAGQEKSKLAKSDSKASSSSDSSGISSPSPMSSPVQMSATEPVDMPKPPPFTVPPLRRYSDLAADLSFISSAAKAAEKANESESKADVLLKRNPGTAPLERPRSWVGPETESKQRPRMWSSAFKPVSFDAQSKKGVRPVDFQIKSFVAPPAVPNKPTAPSASHSTASVHGDAPVTETLRTKQPDNSADKEVEKSSKPAPFVPGKPSVVSMGKSTAPVISMSARVEESSSNQTVKPYSKVERTPSNPLTKKADSGKTKYEIIYSNTSSTSQSSSQVQSDKIDGGSKYESNAAALREQIMRDQSRAQSKVMRDRPQSAIVGGSKFQILTANEKWQGSNGMPSTDAKKSVTIQPKGVSWTHTKHQTNDNSSRKPDISLPQPSGKLQPPVKPAVADSKPLPTVVMRTKTEQQDSIKRHSLPTYIIEGANRKPPVKTTCNKEGNFNFIVEEAKTDTTVVPRGVVAAMKALREKKGITEDAEEGVVDLEHTQ